MKLLHGIIGHHSNASTNKIDLNCKHILNKELVCVCERARFQCENKINIWNHIEPTDGIFNCVFEMVSVRKWNGAREIMEKPLWNCLMSCYLPLDHIAFPVSISLSISFASTFHSTMAYRFACNFTVLRIGHLPRMCWADLLEQTNNRTPRKNVQSNCGSTFDLHMNELHVYVYVGKRKRQNALKCPLPIVCMRVFFFLAQPI